MSAEVPRMRGGHDPRELARRSAEARRQNATANAQPVSPLSDRERPLQALRRGLESNNAAASVASAKAVLDLTPAESEFALAISNARHELAAKVDVVAARRARAWAELGVCPACGRPNEKGTHELVSTRLCSERGCGNEAISRDGRCGTCRSRRLEPATSAYAWRVALNQVVEDE